MTAEARPAFIVTPHTEPTAYDLGVEFYRQRISQLAAEIHALPETDIYGINQKQELLEESYLHRKWLERRHELGLLK